MKAPAALLCLALLLAPAAALAAAPEDFVEEPPPAPEQPKNPDPLEKFNRAMFKINDAMDLYFLVPVTKGYRAALPGPARRGIFNFMLNFARVNTIPYQVLQGKPAGAATTLARMLINVTLGFGGLFDPATDMGIPSYFEDLDQTLGVWGIGPGPYLVIPFLGPSTVRGMLARSVSGLALDFQARQLDEDQFWAVFVIDSLAFREALLGAEQIFSGDKYATFRDAYLSRLEWNVRDGKIEDDSEEVDALLDDLFEEDWGDEDLDEDDPFGSRQRNLPQARRPIPIDFPWPISIYSPERKRLALMHVAHDFSLVLPPPEAAEQAPQPKTATPVKLERFSGEARS